MALRRKGEIKANIPPGIYSWTPDSRSFTALLPTSFVELVLLLGKLRFCAPEDFFFFS